MELQPLLRLRRRRSTKIRRRLRVRPPHRSLTSPFHRCCCCLPPPARVCRISPRHPSHLDVRPYRLVHVRVRRVELELRGEGRPGTSLGPLRGLERWEEEVKGPASVAGHEARDRGERTNQRGGRQKKREGPKQRAGPREACARNAKRCPPPQRRARPLSPPRRWRRCRPCRRVRVRVRRRRRRAQGWARAHRFSPR